MITPLRREAGSMPLKLFMTKTKFFNGSPNMADSEFMKTLETQSLLIELINSLLTISSTLRSEGSMLTEMETTQKNIYIRYMIPIKLSVTL